MRCLLFKLGAIGDVLMLVPAAHALHRRGYTVDWVCGQGIAPVLALYPWINVLAVEERPLLTGSPAQRLAALLALWRRLAGRGRYDLCATLYYDVRYRLLTAPVRAARHLRLSTTRRDARLLPGRHHSSEYLRLLAPLPDDELPHKLAPVPVDPAQLAAHADPASSIPGDPSSPLVLLAPAGARNLLRADTLRRWPIELYVALAESLLARGHRVALLGGPGDEWASAAFAPLPVADRIGRLSLLGTLALLDSAALVVTHDTGPLHLAALTRAAIVAPFGPTDPHVFLPARDNTTALWGGEGFACRPCYDGRRFAACTHNGCLHQVTPALVLAEIETLLAARRERRTLPPRILTPPPTPPLVTL